jgi:hypothetical protein
VTFNLSLISQIFSGSGQILQPRQFYRSPGLAKIAPWWLARRDSFSAKVPGLVSADGATNAYCPYQRAVSVHFDASYQLTKDFKRILSDKAQTNANFTIIKVSERLLNIMHSPAF